MFWELDHLCLGLSVAFGGWVPQAPLSSPHTAAVKGRRQRDSSEQVSADADRPARRTASRPSCCTQRWTLSV